MYVLNQKSSHFPNNLPNGPMYFSDNQTHSGVHMTEDQLSYSSCIPSMMNNNLMQQSNIGRFINPQNGNSVRQPSIMSSAMMPQGNKSQRSSLNNGHIPDQISMSFQAIDNFPNLNAPYKLRNPPMDSIQSIVNTQNKTNLVTDVINLGNIPADPTMTVNPTSTIRVQAPRNKRTRTSTSRSQTPNVKEAMHIQATVAQIHDNPIKGSTSTNVDLISSTSVGPPHQKSLPSVPMGGNISHPYNLVDMIPQQMRPRISTNVINSFGCNRPQMTDKNVVMFPPISHSSTLFSQSPQSISPFFSQMDVGLPLPMFHLHSRLSNIPECDRLIFPVNHGNLWGPLTLRHGDQVTEVKFELNQDNLQQIINRSDLDIVVTSFTHRDQFRLCHWPEFLELKLNGNLLTLDTTILQDLKVHMPCCIKRFCKLGMNVLQFTVSKCVCCHLFQTYMVHRPTLSHALETIKNKCTSTFSTKTILSEIYSKNPLPPTNIDDKNNLCVVSLICPMSQTRITVPARTKCCKHVQPFDLLEFLKVQTKWPQYFCPICRVRVTFNLNEYIQNIAVDEVIQDIITQAEPNVQRVIIYPDGKWKPLNDNLPGTTAFIQQQNLQDSYDHENSMQVIRRSPLSSKSTIFSPQSITQQKTNLSNDINMDNNPNLIQHLSEHEFSNSDMKTVISPQMNNKVCSSTILSPTLSRNNCSMLESHSRSNTPPPCIGLEPSSQKKSKRSPNHQRFNDSFTNMSLAKFSNLPFETQKPLPQQNDMVNLNSPESIRTPLSVTSITSANNKQYHSTNIDGSHNKPFAVSTNSNLGNTVISSHENHLQVNLDSDVNIISSTTVLNSNLPLRASTSVNVNNANKQTSSGSSNPSSPPEFFEPHSSTTIYEDDDNSSMHLQRLIGFIDEILSEEEEYVLDTQWASFTWPSADKSLDLLHLSDIEKLL